MEDVFLKIDGLNCEKDEFIKGINNKIQILDFMKNSELQDMNPLQNFNLENTEV